MKVVLLRDIKKLGKKSEVIEVSDGYARNVLIKNGDAKEATNKNLNDLKLQLKNEEKKDGNLRKEATALSEKISKESFVLKIKTGQSGKTYGSIGSKDISELLKEKLDIDVDKRDIDLDDPIKTVGRYSIKVKLYKDITADVNLTVEDL